jgi:hypothetical protein
MSNILGNLPLRADIYQKQHQFTGLPSDNRDDFATALSPQNTGLISPSCDGAASQETMSRPP